MNAKLMLWFYGANLLPMSVGLSALPFEIWPCVLLNLLVITTGSIAGLACVWAGLGKPHWFWRMAVVIAAASTPLLTSAYELPVWFFAQGVVTIPPLLFVRSRRARNESSEDVAPDDNKPTSPRRMQWTLRDQLVEIGSCQE